MKMYSPNQLSGPGRQSDMAVNLHITCKHIMTAVLSISCEITLCLYVVTDDKPTLIQAIA